MKKKISLLVLCGVLLLGICGCGNNKLESRLVNSVFVYRNATSSAGIKISYVFYKDGKGKYTMKASADFGYNKTKDYEFVYNINGDKIIINDVEGGKSEYTYNYDTDCLIDKNGDDWACKD